MVLTEPHGNVDAKPIAFVELANCAHNEQYECASCADRRHLEQHPAGDVDGCRVCKIRGIRIYGRFTGDASMSDAVQEFYSSGDPGVFDRQDAAAQAARADRRTRIG